MAQALFSDPYAQDTLRAIDEANANPAPEATPAAPSQILSTITSPFRGAAAGAAQAAAFGFDTIKSFGDVVAGYTANTDPSLLMDPQAQAKRWQEGEQARADLSSGAAYSSTIGDNLYGFSSGLAPDPATANIAEQTLFGLSRGLTKIVGMSLASGNPYIGVTLAGASEGEAASQDLKEKGVDLGTRSMVGAVTGAGTAAGALIPVAGSTLGRTVALGLGAGPGLQVAQTAMTRAVLQSAGYQHLADQYDPFDPVAIAVSAAMPAIFGGLAYRGVRADAAAARSAPKIDPALARPLESMGFNERRALQYDAPQLDDYAVQAATREGVSPDLMLALKNAGERSNSDQVSGKGAAGVSQMTKANRDKFGVVDPTDPVQAIDGMARYLAATKQQYGDNLRAIIADYDGGPKQAQAVMQGRQPPSPETQAYLARVERYLADRGANDALRGVRLTLDQVDAARVAYNRQLLEGSSLGAPDDLDAMATHLTAFQRTIDQLSAGSRVDVGDIVEPDQVRQAGALDGMIEHLEDVRSDLMADMANQAEPGQIAQLRAQIADLQTRAAPTLEDVAGSMQPRRTYTPTATRSAREQAQIERNAPVELQSQLDARDAQITRLQAAIEENRNAEIARAAMPHVDRLLDGFRAHRDALDLPPGRVRGDVAAARQVIDEAAAGVPRETSDASGVSETPRMPEAAGNTVSGRLPAADEGRASASPVSAATVVGSERVAEADGATPTQGRAQSGGSGEQQPDYQPQLEAESADMPGGVAVDPETGETRIVTLGEQLDAARAEYAAQKELAPLMRVAAQCFLAHGD